MSNILVINANPKPQSFCAALAQQYASSAGDTHQVQLLQLSELQFEMDLQSGYQALPELEPDLQRFQQALLWAEHLVIVSPVWWGSIPAKFKGLIDRTLLPGFAFKYEAGSSIPRKLLTGRSAELIITLDTPVWWYKWWQGAPIYKQLVHTILSFCGINTRRIRYFGPVLNADESQRQRWLQQVRRLAKKL